MEHNNLFLARFFSRGPALVIAFDHGMFDKPLEGLTDMQELTEKIHPEIDGVLMSPGVLRDIGIKLCGRRPSPMPIVRINWSTIYCFSWDYHSGDTVVAFTPQQALQWGAQLVLVSLSLHTGDQKLDAKNVRIFRQLCAQAHDLGLPVVGEYFPIDDENMSADQLHEDIKIGTRILYELGADAIKTFYTPNFDQVVAGCPVPILALGGKRLSSDVDVLKLAQEQINSGAAGIVYGRNVIQSQNPLNLQKALLEVVKQGTSAETAAQKYGIK